jgi:hypothetical protein
MNWISDISIWWIFPWSILAIYLSVLLYAKRGWVKEVSKIQRTLLISLRSISLILLGVLLLGVLFEYKSYREEKPLIITLIDNSSSVVGYKDSTDVKSNVPRFRAQLREELGSRFDYFDVNLTGANPEKLAFNGEETNLSEVLEKVHADFYNRNVGGVILISDGNYNKGSNPLYMAERFNLTPFFTIGLGDTVPKKDHFIKGVTTNDFAFLKNQFPIEVEVEAIKMGIRSATVSITHNGKVVANQSINYDNPSYSFKQLNFNLDANIVGIQRYTVNLAVVDGEYNTKNNSRNVYIEVLDARSRVLLLAGAPHPDIAAIKSVMEQDENLTVESHLTKDWDKNLKDVDLIVWHEPGWQNDPSLIPLLTSKNIPTFYIVGASSQVAEINRLGIGLKLPGGNQTDDVDGKYNSAFVPFEVSDNLKQFFDFLPPLKSRFGTTGFPAGIDVFLYQRIGSIQKKDPLLYFGKQKGVKYGVLYGEGLWRWKINDFQRNGSFESFNEFIQKITQYLVVRQNTSPFVVSLPKRITKAEELVVKAEFYNESMELITTPTINFNLKNENGKLNKFQFGQSGNAYRLNAGKLAPGSYTWQASTSFNGKSYQKSGTFIVEDLLLESLDNQANHQVLQQIANQTNGKFYTLKDSQKIFDDMKARKDLVNISYAESVFIDLIDWKIIFFLILLALVAEWSMRRYFGGY